MKPLFALPSHAFPLLLAALLVSGCGSGTAEPAGEIILLSHYENEWVSPVPEAVAQVEGGTVETGADGATRVPLAVDGRALSLVEYGGHAQIVRRLEDTARPPVAAVLVVMGTHGISTQHHGQQLDLAKAAGVPVVAALLSQIHAIDDEELLDLIETFDITETLTERGYTEVPVIRGSAVKAVEGDAEGRASMKTLVAAMRRQLGPVLAAR